MRSLDREGPSHALCTPSLPPAIRCDTTLRHLRSRLGRAGAPVRTCIPLLDVSPRLVRGGVLPPAGIPRGDIVELVGDAGCGKSRVVYAVLARALLEGQRGIVGSGGGRDHAVLFDIDLRFDVQGFLRILHRTALCLAVEGGDSPPPALACFAPGGDAAARTNVLEGALSCLLVLRPHNLPDLAVLLEAVSSGKASAAPLGDSSAPLVVALDGLTVWRWQCREWRGVNVLTSLARRVADSLTALSSGPRSVVLLTRGPVGRGAGASDTPVWAEEEHADATLLPVGAPAQVVGAGGWEGPPGGGAALGDALRSNLPDPLSDMVKRSFLLSLVQPGVVVTRRGCALVGAGGEGLAAVAGLEFGVVDDTLVTPVLIRGVAPGGGSREAVLCIRE